MTQRTKEESESQSHAGEGELGKGGRRGKPPVLRSPLGARVSSLTVRKVGSSEIMKCTKASSTQAFSEAGYVSGSKAWLAGFTLCKRHRPPFSLAPWLILNDVARQWEYGSLLLHSCRCDDSEELRIQCWAEPSSVAGGRLLVITSL